MNSTEACIALNMLPTMGPPETTIWEYPFPDRSWSAEIADFAHAIDGRAAPCGDLSDAIANLEIIAQAYASQRR